MIRWVAIALLVVGCSSSRPTVNADPTQKGRVMEAKARAESLLGQPLKTTVNVSFEQGEKLLAVKDVNGRSRKVWVKKVYDQSSGHLLGYRAGLNYRNHIIVYHKPGDVFGWEFDVLVHELGHSVLGGTAESDHARMKEAGFAF